MSATERQRPIGLFDSGVGGLTVARELHGRLPCESLLYYGDTTHVPYGDRPVDEIVGFAVGIARFLESEGAKLIVAACNTVSAVAMEAMRASVGVPVLGVIEGGARAAAAAAGAGTVGVLATSATVASQAYPRAITALRPDVTVRQVACPRFVPLVESGRSGFTEAYEAVEQYVSQLPIPELDAVVLGCTHYALLFSDIKMWLAESTYLIDPALQTANLIAAHLAATDALADGPARHRLLASGPAASLDRVNHTHLSSCFPPAEAAPVVAAAPLPAGLA